MIVAPLGSGSAGNSTWFASDGTNILVDAGFGPRETKKRLEMVGGDIEQLAAIVITHEHYDHIRGAEKIARKYGLPIYLTRGTLEASRIDRDETSLVVFDNNSTFTIGELSIHSRQTIHDAAIQYLKQKRLGRATFQPVPLMRRVDVSPDLRKLLVRPHVIGLASDLGYVDGAVLEHLSNCDGLFFESNHDIDMLRMGTYPWSLKRRILSRFGHLSNDDAMRAVQRMIGAETKTLCLIHLSQQNNHETIVRDMAARLLARTGAQLELGIAKQFEPTGVFTIARRGGRRPPVIPRGVQMALF